ncbi:hypothetical protein OOJ96_02360 [Pseudomonas sp. 15FMM2]|uniref:Uncharacterized protein n=1 Tax=Pseudomonas imrae TaxID=2992837 RepID=A0ACC7P9L0_9PSED
MLQLTLIQDCPRSDALRSVVATCVTGLSALVSFYFGYWFSHWRA